jgi:hypothetical protein
MVSSRLITRLLTALWGRGTYVLPTVHTCMHPPTSHAAWYISSRLGKVPQGWGLSMEALTDAFSGLVSGRTMNCPSSVRGSGVGILAADDHACKLTAITAPLPLPLPLPCHATRAGRRRGTRRSCGGRYGGGLRRSITLRRQCRTSSLLCRVEQLVAVFPCEERREESGLD